MEPPSYEWKISWANSVLVFSMVSSWYCTQPTLEVGQHLGLCLTQLQVSLVHTHAQTQAHTLTHIHTHTHTHTHAQNTGREEKVGKKKGGRGMGKERGDGERRER